MEATDNQREPGSSLIAGEATHVPKGENLPPALRGFFQLPRGRQVGFIVTVALAVAVAVAVVLWANHKDYERLFFNLPEKEAGEIVEALKKLNTDYELDRATGAILVPADKVHELRLKLATQGLPREGEMGFDALDKGSSFGTSQMMEGVRFQHALEGEIARSVMTIHGVRSARVHLALPKESVFVRQPKKASASVVVELGSGYGLEPGQVEGIVHMVAASVPQLEPSQVTVVDGRGHLLNSRDSTSGMNLTAKQFDYKRQFEDHLIERVENILSPVVGREGMRTQATVDLDFTETERTQELYNPDLPALRSEQVSEEQNRAGAAPQGVPGALSNQPPPAGVAPETTGQNPPAAGAGQAAAPATAQAPAQPASASKSATRNYELDKTISHSRLGTGDVRRLTVAVVVDHQRIQQPDGSYTSQPYSDEDLNRFSSLVKEAVGYDATRSDRVTVTNAAFRVEQAVPVEPVWEQPWFWSIAKQIGAGLVLILLIFGVLRPAVRGLVGRDRAAPSVGGPQTAVAGALPAGAVAGAVPGAVPELAGPGGYGEGAMEGPDDVLLLEAPQSYEKRLEFAQRAIDNDPKRVAQVIKLWMTGEQNNG
ncbi:MAG: flagellar basal body M-ring protein FliF [Methylococcaceae bacterium]|nr:flagellar basal body M-ring protein FliF [Methylococcaceae bacterium]